MHRWDGLICRYLEECRARGLSEGFVETVARESDRLGGYLKRRRPRLSLEEVTMPVLIGYLRGRTAFKAKATVYGVVSIVKGIGRFLYREGAWVQDPARWIRGPKLDCRSRLPRRIGRERMRKLWEAAAGGRQGYSRSLWLAILATLYGTGLRRGELVRLRVRDWDGAEGLLRIDGRKTGRARSSMAPKMVVRCMEHYLAARQNHLLKLGCMDEEALFVNRQGRRLTAASVSGGIRRLADRAGIEKVTLHMFRHSCASELIEEGLSLPEVQAVLGHQSIGTTMRYLSISDPRRHQAVSHHPLNDILAVEGVAS